MTSANFTTLIAAAALLSPALGAAQGRWETTVTRIERGEWTGPRLPDGQPDIAGHWSNTIANHDNLTDPQGGIPGDVARAGGGGARAIGTVARPVQRAPSRVTDPPDGQVPFQPWARAVQRDLLAHFFNPTEEQYIEPLARCAPAGPTKSLTWHGYEIRQYPGYVVFLFDSGTRIVHLDGKPHLPEQVKLWNGDSRGRWEGNTLAVDVRNNNGKARLARTGEFASENVAMEERFIFAADGLRYVYEATYTDPTVYTRPWTLTIPAKKYTVDSPPDDWHYQTWDAVTKGGERVVETYERTCVENNSGHGEVALGG
jgi:hypothetical protein